MKRNIVFVFIIFCAFACIGCTSRESEERTVSKNRSAQAAATRSVQSSSETIQSKLLDLGIGVTKEKTESIDFALEDLTGTMRKLSSYRGNVVFLNFWATWCGPCRIEMPSMQLLYDKLKDEGLEIVAVDLQESKKSVKAFVDRYKLSFPVLLDKNGEVGLIYGAMGIPTTYLIDRDGYVFAGAKGAREWDTPQMISVFKEILQKRVVYGETSGMKESEVELTGETKEVTIEAYNWGFRKSPVTIRKGDKVRLAVKTSEGKHGVAIPAFNVESGAVENGNEKVIEFIATKVGKILYGCYIPCGAGHVNMIDTLEILE